MSATMPATRMDSITTNEIIDHELDLLLASPPDINTASDDNVTYSMVPSEFKLAFKNMSPNDDHVFSSLRNITSSSLSTNTFQARHGGDDTVHVIDKLRDDAVPIWVVSHDINLCLNSKDIVASTPISPFTNKSQGELLHPLNLLNGVFESYLKIDVKGNTENGVSMLAWNCFTKVYKTKSKQIILESVEPINAYWNLSDKLYNLQFPFLSNFFAGYLNFLTNGSHSKDDDALRIVQVLYKNTTSDVKFNHETSNIYAYLIHEVLFNKTSNASGTEINVIEIVKKDAKLA